MNKRRVLTLEEAASLPLYSDVYVRRYGARRTLAACTTGVPHMVEARLLVPYAYTFVDRGERVLHRETKVAILGGPYSDEVEQ